MSLISNTSIKFHSQDQSFGTYTIEMANNINILLTEQYIHFTIDCSGSMDDICLDRRSKMDHLKFTIKNILRWLVNNNTNVYIEIDAFDSKIKPVVGPIKLTTINIEEIINKVNKIYPDNLTNIELALNNVKEKINAFGILNPHVTINEIFLTDGEISAGETDITKLSELLEPLLKYTFIGFGEDHDSNLLVSLANNCNGTYKFIDAIEKSSLIYGEILNKIFYLCYDNVSINIRGGEIYNYKTNTWSNYLNIGGLVAEENKTFHIRTNNEDINNIIIVTYGILVNANNLTHCKDLITSNSDNIIIEDLTKYIYRHKVLELLYKGQNLEIVKPNWFDKFANNNSNTKLKQEINNLLEEIKQYITNNNLTNDNFLKLLIDDLYIAYKTLKSRNGHKYICSRHISQGSQQIYSVNYNDDDDYKFTGVKDSPYRNSNCVNVMRDVSIGTQAEDDI